MRQAGRASGLDSNVLAGAGVEEFKPLLLSGCGLQQRVFLGYFGFAVLPGLVIGTYGLTVDDTFRYASGIAEWGDWTRSSPGMNVCGYIG